MYWYKLSYDNPHKHKKEYVLFGGINFYEVNQKISRWIEKNNMKQEHVFAVEVQDENFDEQWNGTIVV